VEEIGAEGEEDGAVRFLCGGGGEEKEMMSLEKSIGCTLVLRLSCERALGCRYNNDWETTRPTKDYLTLTARPIEKTENKKKRLDFPKFDLPIKEIDFCMWLTWSETDIRPNTSH
jgi:hypothetical protein